MSDSNLVIFQWLLRCSRQLVLNAFDEYINSGRKTLRNKCGCGRSKQLQAELIQKISKTNQSVAERYFTIVSHNSCQLFLVPTFCGSFWKSR